MAIAGIGIVLCAVGALMLIIGVFSVLPPYHADQVTNGFIMAIAGPFIISAGGWVLNLLRR